MLEGSDTHGGKAGVVHRGGFTFDTGPSLFTLPEIYRDLFRVTGRELEDCVDLVPVEPGFGYHFADGSGVDLPGMGVDRVSAAMAEAFGPETGAAWQSLMARAGRMWQLTNGPFLRQPLSGVRDLVGLARDPRDIAAIAPWRTLRGFGAELPDPRARMILDRYATYTGSDPRRAPGVMLTIPYIEDTYGAWHVAGGLRVLADALAQRVRELGVQVRLNTSVTRIVADPAVRAVETADGQRIAAQLVVANADARNVYADLLPAELGRAPLARLARATPSLAGFVILLGLSGRTPDLRHNNVWFPEHYDAEFDDIFGPAPRPVADPTIYACVPEDDLMRPPDGESWFLLVNAPRHSAGATVPGTIDWDQPGRSAQYADHVLTRLAEHGVDVRGRIREQVVISPADLERRVSAPGGAIYGTSSNGTRAAFLRPANRSPVPGLYLVGGSAHPGGGLPLVALSAQIVARMIGPA